MAPDSVFGAFNNCRHLFRRTCFRDHPCSRVADHLDFQTFIVVVLFCCGLSAFTLAEYITHRFVLHAIAPLQHGIHHARPRDPVDRIFWQIWLAFVVVYLTTGGAVVAGALVAYAWYLFVHYCAHQNPAILPAPLLKHHLDHHRFANRNYGVTTTFWDRVFGTMLR